MRAEEGRSKEGGEGKQPGGSRGHGGPKEEDKDQEEKAVSSIVNECSMSRLTQRRR